MITIAEIAKLVGGVVHGDASLEILAAAPIRDAQVGYITLADDPKFESKLRACQASAVIIPADFPKSEKTCVVVDDVHTAFAKIVKYLDPPVVDSFAGISPTAIISPSAKIGEGCVIHPYAVIGDNVQLSDRVHVGAGVVIEAGCSIDEDTRLYPRCVLYSKTKIGKRCVLHAGVVVGAFGFGYLTKQGKHYLSAQLGNVIIEDDVEIGANTTIDRGTYNATVIGEGTKIDNQVMIAHNCRLGKHNLICSQVGIAGSCRTGDYVVLAGQVGIGDHVDIGTGATLAAKSGVMNHIPAKSVYMGIPATPIKDQMKTFAVVNKLSQWYGKWKDMLTRIERIEALIQSIDSTSLTSDSDDDLRNGHQGKRAA